MIGGNMDAVTIKRVDITNCKDCIFYSFEKGGCVIDHDSDQDPFACVVDEKHMMWVQITTEVSRNGAQRNDRL